MSDGHDGKPSVFSRRRAARVALTAVVGTAATVLAAHEAKAGYGACSGGCPCPQFQGNQQLCGNCGHNYTRHW